jgi:hypothetical protein
VESPILAALLWPHVMMSMHAACSMIHVLPTVTVSTPHKKAIYILPETRVVASQEHLRNA